MADLSINCAGIKSPNPFWLASAPPTNSGAQIQRAFGDKRRLLERILADNQRRLRTRSWIDHVQHHECVANMVGCGFGDRYVLDRDEDHGGLLGDGEHDARSLLKGLPETTKAATRAARTPIPAMMAIDRNWRRSMGCRW